MNADTHRTALENQICHCGIEIVMGKLAVDCVTGNFSDMGSSDVSFLAEHLECP